MAVDSTKTSLGIMTECPWDHLCIIHNFRQHNFFPTLLLYTCTEHTVSRVPVPRLCPNINDSTWHNRGSLQCGYFLTMIKTVSMKNAKVFVSQMSNKVHYRLYIYQTSVEPWRIWWFGVLSKAVEKAVSDTSSKCTQLIKNLFFSFQSLVQLEIIPHVRPCARKFWRKTNMI